MARTHTHTHTNDQYIASTRNDTRYNVHIKVYSRRTTSNCRSLLRLGKQGSGVSVRERGNSASLCRTRVFGCEEDACFSSRIEQENGVLLLSPRAGLHIESFTGTHPSPRQKGNERAWKKDPNAISSPSTRALTQRYKALGFFIVIGARRDTRRRRLPQKENANVGPRCVFGATRWKKTSHGELSVCTSHTQRERERMKPKPRRRICTIIDVLSFLSFSTSLYYKRNNFHHRVMQ